MAAEWGVFAVSRGIWGDTDFAPEPFTEREAWMWLCSAAAWRPLKVGTRYGAISLERGEFFHSVRFLAEKWRWQKDRVVRFLKRLENRDMIRDTTADRSRDRQRVYFINNYNEYQRVALPKRDSNADTDATANATATRQQRDKEENIQSIQTSKSISSEFDDWYAAYPKHEAPGHAEKAYQKARKTATAAELLAAATRYAELRSGEDAKFTKLPATWLNARCWMDEPVQAGTPMKIPKNRVGFVDLPPEPIPAIPHENRE